MSQPGNRPSPGRVLNEIFSQRLEVCEGKEKIAEYSGDYIRERLMEVSFRRKFGPGRIRRAWWWILRKLGLIEAWYRLLRKMGLRKEPVHQDTLVKIIDVDPKSKAMALTFRGQPSKAFTRKEIENATED
jgi:hypothetical protein